MRNLELYEWEALCVNTRYFAVSVSVIAPHLSLPTCSPSIMVQQPACLADLFSVSLGAVRSSASLSSGRHSLYILAYLW